MSTENVAAAQIALVNSLNRVASEATTVRTQTQFLIQAQEEYAAAQRRAKEASDAAAKAAADAARTLQSAFGTVGVRSAQELEAEIRQVRDAMELVRTGAGLTGRELSVAMASGNARIKELERSLREVRGELTLADQAAGLLKNSMGQIAAGNLIADGIGALVNKVKELGREFVATIVQTEQLRRGLNAVYKDVGVTTAQFEFLRKTAGENGIAIGAVSDAFVRFSAAMKSANIPVAESNALFASVTRTAGSLGLSAEATGGALDALGQIASKGVVSLEELRQQLGDRLPGALGAAAKGLGLTEAELIKLVESGGLAARDFFPAFTQGLKELQGEADGLVPTFNRLTNALTIATQNAGDAGAVNVLTGALKLLGAAVGIVVGLLTGFVESIGLVAKSLALAANPALTWAQKLEILKEELAAAAERQSAFSAAIDQALNPTQQATAATTALATAIQRAKDAATAAGVNWDGLSRSQQASAIAAQVAGNAQLSLGGRIASTNAAITALLEAQSKETEALGKLAKAAKEQGDTLVALAKLQGDEKSAVEAAAQAAELYAAAQAKVAASRAQEVNLLEQQLATILRVRSEEVKQGKLSQEQLDKETEALRNKIKTAKSEEEQSRASAEAARQELEVRRLSVQMYGDQSAKLKEYEADVLRLRTTLAEYVRLNIEGKKSDEEVKAVREALAKATAKYNDTVQDSIAKKRLESQEAASGLQITLASRNAEVQLYEAKAQSARASGDLRMATYYETEAKRAKIEADKLSIQIKEIELKLEKAELQLKLDGLKLTDPTNKLKIEELELRLKLTGVKEKEIEASKELLRIKESEILTGQRLSGVINGEGSARGGVIGAIGSQSDAMEKLMMRYKLSADYSQRQIELLEQEAAAAEKAAEAKRKYWNVDKDGFTLDANGQRMQQSVPTDRYVLDTAKSQGLSDKQAIELVDRFIRNGEGVGTINGMDWFSSVNKAISDLVVEEARKRANGQGGAPGTPGTPTTPTTPTTATNTPTTTTPSNGFSSGRTSMTINIGGIGTTIGLNSQADANRLAGVFRQIEEASRSSS